MRNVICNQRYKPLHRIALYEISDSPVSANQSATYLFVFAPAAIPINKKINTDKILLLLYINTITNCSFGMMQYTIIVT